MAITVPVGESVKLIDSSNPNREFEFAVSGNGVRVGRSKATATEENAKRIFAGDRGELLLDPGESIYAFNDDVKDNGKPAQVDIEKQGFVLSFQPRSVLATVETTAEDREAPARSDDFIFEGAIDRTIPANGSVSIDFEAPDRADDVGILAEFDAAGEVEVGFAAGAGDPIIASRTPTQDGTYATAGSPAQIYKSVLIVAPHVTVTFSDTSGASNDVNYAVYAR